MLFIYVILFICLKLKMIFIEIIKSVIEIESKIFLVILELFLFFVFCLDQTLQTNIKDEKKDYYVDNHLKTSPISTDKIDQPLLIVLDEDDINGDDENEQSNLIINETISKDDLSNNEEQNINNNSSTGISFIRE